MTERMREQERKREREKERMVVSFVAYFSLRWEIRKLLAVLPLSLWSDRGPKKSTEIRNQRRDVYFRARLMLDDAPVMRAYPALLVALPPPVGEGGEAEDNNFNDDEDGSGKVELFATDDDVINFRNVRSWSDACARRCRAHCTAHALQPLSHARYMDDTNPKDWNGSHVRWW